MGKITLYANLEKFIARDSERERPKNAHAQLVSDLDHRRQIRSIHPSRSAFTGGGESGRSNLEGMVG